MKEQRTSNTEHPTPNIEGGVGMLRSATKSELLELLEWCFNQSILSGYVRENAPKALTRIREKHLLKEMQDICDKLKGCKLLEHRKLMDRFTVINSKLAKIQDRYSQSV